MILYCCEKCAKKAKSNNPSFNIGKHVFFIGDIPECDICGEVADLFRCEDPDDESDGWDKWEVEQSRDDWDMDQDYT